MKAIIRMEKMRTHFVNIVFLHWPHPLLRDQEYNAIYA